MSPNVPAQMRWVIESLFRLVSSAVPMKSRICCRKIVNRILKACTHAAGAGSATLTAKLQSLGLLQINPFGTTIRLFYLRYCKNIGTYATQGGLYSMASSRKTISICLSTHLYETIVQWSIYVTSSRGFVFFWYFMILIDCCIYDMCVFCIILLIVWSALLTAFSDWMQSVSTRCSWWCMRSSYHQLLVAEFVNIWIANITCNTS